MAAGGSSGGRKKDARQERERERLYQARTRLHDALNRRRLRDNVWVSVAAGVVILAAFGAQGLYYGAGPGASEPTPTVSPETTVQPTPLITPAPSPETSPESQETPAPEDG